MLGLVWWGYVVGVFQGAVGGDTCINHAPSFSPPQELAAVSFPPSTHTQGPVGGCAWNQSCDVLRPVPERAMLLVPAYPATMNLTCSASETKDGYPSG